MIQSLRPAFVLLVLFTLLTGLAYPLALTGAARLMFPSAAGGSLVVANGAPRGSGIVGQSFTQPGYFHPRPSASGYDGMASGGSNLGPLSRKLLDRVGADIAALGGKAGVAADAVTASASGLDPDISPQNAIAQVPRVAAARGMPEDDVRSLVEGSVRPRIFGVFGEPHVNVLSLNLALDAIAPP